MSDIVDSAVVKVKADMSGFVESLTAAKETVSELNRELERTVELALRGGRVRLVPRRRRGGVPPVVQDVRPDTHR